MLNTLSSHCLASMELDIGVTHSDLSLGIYVILFCFLLWTTNNAVSHCFSSYLFIMTHVVVAAAEAESWFAAETSTGYLEDVIAGWGIWCKHHNLPSYSQDQKVNYVYVCFHVLYFFSTVTL